LLEEEMKKHCLSLLIAVSILGTVPASSDAEIPGTLKWKKEIGGSIGYHSPAIGEDGTIYVGSMDGHLYAIHGESGGLADSPRPMYARDLRHTGRAEP
jgi:hypothetical protein